MTPEIDFEHWLGSQIGYQLLENAELEKKLLVIKNLNPSFSKDGNQWCYLYGDLPDDCIVGFGNTPSDAMNDFVNNFYTKNAVLIK